MTAVSINGDRSVTTLSTDDDAGTVRRTSVAVCACTFRRPGGLRRLLASLADLAFETAYAPRVSIVVVDNDPDGSARSTVDELAAAGYRWPLAFVVEPRPGIPQARNRCLANVAPGTNFVCFVDDDEVVDADWLSRLLAAQRTYEADVVAGPSLPDFPANAPAWVRGGRFFDWKRFRTGQTITEAATGNVLFRPELAARHGIRFNEQMALTGGTDKLYFVQLRSCGARMVWCDEAIARETIPAHRTRASWFIQRGFRIGTTDARIAKITEGCRRGAALVVWRATTRTGWALLSLPVCLVLGKGPFVYNASRLAYGVGSLVGLFGGTYDEYAAARRAPATT